MNRNARNIIIETVSLQSKNVKKDNMVAFSIVGNMLGFLLISKYHNASIFLVGTYLNFDIVFYGQIIGSMLLNIVVIMVYLKNVFQL